jgi:hypothetical protein
MQVLMQQLAIMVVLILCSVWMTQCFLLAAMAVMICFLLLLVLTVLTPIMPRVMSLLLVVMAA